MQHPLTALKTLPRCPSHTFANLAQTNFINAGTCEDESPSGSVRTTHTRLVPGSKHAWCKSPLVCYDSQFNNWLNSTMPQLVSFKCAA